MSMAEPLDDGEFWLPAEFLAEDDLATEKEFIHLSNNVEDKGSAHSNFNGVIFCKNADREGVNYDYRYLVELNRKLAAATVVQGNKIVNPKDRHPSAAPLSSFCPRRLGKCACIGSCRGSLNGGVQGSLSPQNRWNLLYAAAGEVARMKLSERSPSSLRISLDAAAAQQLYSPSDNYNESRTRSLHCKLQTNLHLRQQLIEYQALVRYQSVRGFRPNVFPSFSPSNESSPRSLYKNGKCDSRPVFQQQFVRENAFNGAATINTTVKKQSAGTGVFLPRRNLVPLEPESRVDTGSAVILPAKVVEALNFNFEELLASSRFQHNRLGDGFNTPNNMAKACEYLAKPLQELNYASGTNFPTDFRLPHEWTY